MVNYVRQHPGAIGYVSHGHVSGIEVVQIEELSPVARDIQDGGYHLVQPFYLVALEEPTGAARLFVDFCLGPAGQEIVAGGYVPVRATGQ